MSLQRLSLQATNRPLDVIIHWRDGGNLLLDPPYQRGDVWGPVRQRNLIRSILMGIPIPSLIVNSRLNADIGGNSEWADDYRIAVIDGKQRITAVLKFLDGDLSVPAEWFSDDFAGEATFDMLPIGMQRRFQNTPLPFAEGTLKTLAAEIEVFELVNYGGVPQGESDNP